MRVLTRIYNVFEMYSRVSRHSSVILVFVGVFDCILWYLRELSHERAQHLEYCANTLKYTRNTVFKPLTSLEPGIMTVYWAMHGSHGACTPAGDLPVV